MRKPRRYLLMYVLSTQVFNFTFTKAIQWKVACITKWVENNFDEIHMYFFLIPVPLHFFNADNVVLVYTLASGIDVVPTFINFGFFPGPTALLEST